MKNILKTATNLFKKGVDQTTAAVDTSSPIMKNFIVEYWLLIKFFYNLRKKRKK